MPQELPEGTVTILFTDAFAMYTKIGMPKHVEMANAMLDEPQAGRQKKLTKPRR